MIWADLPDARDPGRAGDLEITAVLARGLGRYGFARGDADRPMAAPHLKGELASVAVIHSCKKRARVWRRPPSMAQVVAQCGDIVVSAGPRGADRRREEHRLPAAIGPVTLPDGARCGRHRPGDSVASGCFLLGGKTAGRAGSDRHCGGYGWTDRRLVGRTAGQLGSGTAGKRICTARCPGAHEVAFYE